MTSTNEAWCWILGKNGRTVRTNAYGDHPDGSVFVAVDTGGTTIGWWATEMFTDATTASAAMAAIWAAASAGTVVDTEEWGAEYEFPLTDGAVCAASDGSHVRVVDRHGDTLDDGSCYWVVDEWVEDPELVTGAILGAAWSLA